MTPGANPGRHLRAGRWRPAMWATIAALLLLPLAAMRFTEEVAWDAFDFAAAAALLIGAGAAFEIALRCTADRKLRVAVAAILLAAVFLIWLEAAVGIF